MNSASLCSLAVRYDNPIPTRFLAPIDCLKIPALDACDLDDSYSITSLPTYVPPLITGLLAQWVQQLSADRPVLPTITTIFRRFRFNITLCRNLQNAVLKKLKESKVQLNSNKRLLIFIDGEKLTELQHPVHNIQKCNRQSNEQDKYKKPG
jgi:hypothetical protein